jgi:hypothetical protein
VFTYFDSSIRASKLAFSYAGRVRKRIFTWLGVRLRKMWCVLHHHEKWVPRIASVVPRVQLCCSALSLRGNSITYFFPVQRRISLKHEKSTRGMARIFWVLAIPCPTKSDFFGALLHGRSDKHGGVGVAVALGTWRNGRLLSLDTLRGLGCRAGRFSGEATIHAHADSFVLSVVA